MIEKVLIANRGEIACRVIRACRAMGIRTVAIYSEADRDALHVRMADEAYLVGPPPSAQSYLRGDRILEVARQAGADALHPGYGFLSENADFREQCERAGVTFIGPPARAMRLMGEKTLARRTMQAAGVPVVPGTTEPLDDPDELRRVAAQVGYPVMLKAAAGGGGKGMRVIEDEAHLVSGFEAARREAIASFGDDAVYVEKAIVGPRHVEVQIMADTHGGVVYVGNRECSVQRRHQKVIEEAPAPNLSPETVRAMGQMAVEAARAVGYVGAGTVECLVDAQESFYFLEMNTRLQVEHCVTEEAFGVDLVRAQLLIASGEPLPWTQDDLDARLGRAHAIELRVYAEDPYQGFLPSPGTLTAYEPPRGPGVRVDDGVSAGAEISSLYDPMIAKLIVSGATREEALTRAHAALREYRLEGIRTNLEFLDWVVASGPFTAGRYTTALLGELGAPEHAPLDAHQRDLARVLAALYVDQRAATGPQAGAGGNHAPNGHAGDERSAWVLAGLAMQHGRRLA